MGFCVLHYDKQTGSSPGLSQHIERGCYRDGEWIEWHPTNADPSRTHLNRELIAGDLSRDERISKRIKDAGIKNPRKDQVRALTLIMSASCEDMQRIMDEGKFDDWCEDSIKWAQETHGAENVVSAVLHLDEKTPHLHVTVVPIVQGISKDQAYREKKAKEATEKGIEQPGKRKYKKKDPNAPRLCAADVMARTKLKEYQTTYAEAVEKFGLSRGIDGSLAKHVDINDWYKSLVTEVQNLESRRASISSEIEDLEETKTKVENAVKNTGRGLGEAIANIGKGIGEGLKEMGTYALPSKARDREKAAQKKEKEALEKAEAEKQLRIKAEKERDLMKTMRDGAFKARDAYFEFHKDDITAADNLRKEFAGMKIKHDELMELIEDSAELGLTASQIRELTKGKEVHLPQITLKGTDTPITPADSDSFRVRFDRKLQIMRKNAWQSVKTWVREARDELRDWLRKQSQRTSRGVGF